VIDPSEVDKLRSEDEKAVTVREFVDADKVDSLYLSGKTYYLIPTDKIGAKPYALLYRGLQEENKVAIAQVVISGKDHLVMVHPVGKLIAMSILQYAGAVKRPEAFEDELQPDIAVTDEEHNLATMLIEHMSSDTFDLSPTRTCTRIVWPSWCRQRSAARNS
jgi:DNA end-binding protein Ku